MFIIWKKRLIEEERDLQERINTFYSNKSDVIEEIIKEKVADPSGELITIEKDLMQVFM